MSSIRSILAAVACALAASSCAGPPVEPLTLATTTSVGNSGLLDELLPAFERQHGFGARAHLAGSGLSLKMLESGDVDLVISHAPASERDVLASHPEWLYRKIMFNDFVLVGPVADPAGVREAADIRSAMKRIAASSVRFLSRGDQSGTHEREQWLWQAAEARPPEGGLVVAGASMGATLRAANETNSYTLSDRATFLRLADSLELAVVFEGGSELLNTYSVIVDPAGPRAGQARRFADWLADGNGRHAIEQFRVEGRQVFHVWPSGRPASTPDATPE